MNGLRILIVEDERVTALDLQSTLQSLGYDAPMIAETAEEALAGVEQLKPDVILMDVRIRSAKDGITVAEEIRCRFGTPVVYLTAYADAETVERASRSEAYGYLLKPFSEQELHTTLQLTYYKAKAERAVRESEERFRKLVENASDMITVVDPSGTILYKGPSVRRVLGYRPEELVGKNVAEVIHPDDRKQALEMLQRCFQNPNDCIPVEYRMLHKYGGWRIMEARGTNRVSDPVVGGIVFNSRDITERTEAEAAIRSAKEEAERASRAKTELLSRASHEMRTPMNAILGFAQVLEIDLKTEEDQESIQQILRAGRHLLSLMDEVLDLARIEAQRMSLSLEAVRITDVLQESVELVRRSAQDRAIELVIDWDSCRAQVSADRQRLKQVILNLLSNAVKYNRKGGTVRVTCKARPGERIRLAISDTGSGIPPEKRTRLFTPFDRLDADRSGIEGTGLGLALSKGLIDTMGGELGVESGFGEGSTFWVELPRARAEDSTAEAGTLNGEVTTDRSRSHRVALYVEDNLSNVRLVERILARRPGITIIPTMQGRLGLELARQHRPDLILLDVHLPDIGGDRVLTELKADPDLRDIPVVVISADATEKQLQTMLNAGAQAYLTKPFVMAQFLSAVDAALGPTVES